MNPVRQVLVLVQKAEQQVLGLDRLGAEPTGFQTRELNRPASLPGVRVEGPGDCSGHRPQQ
jgi:hypothetical protein